MSALPWKYFTSHGVDRSILSASNKEKNTISHPAKTWRRKKKNKIKDSTTELLEVPCDQKRAKKRKLDELLENKTGGVEHNVRDVLDSVSEQSNHVQFKRPRITLSGEALHLTDSWEVDSGFSSETSPPTSGRSSPCVGMDHSRIVAMDCEMVGTGPGGRFSEVARCSIVNYYGSVVYDKYILPRHPVTDYRTRWSGIRKHHLAQAVPFEDAQREIGNILKDKIIVGHALFNDFLVLNISTSAQMIRDTASCSLLRNLFDADEKQKVSLKKLSQKLLNRTIQSGIMGHCSVEDSRAAMDLYKLVGDQWEKNILSWVTNTDCTSNPNNALEHYMQDEYWPESLMDCSL